MYLQYNYSACVVMCTCGFVTHNVMLLGCNHGVYIKWIMHCVSVVCDCYVTIPLTVL